MFRTALDYLRRLEGAFPGAYTEKIQELELDEAIRKQHKQRQHIQPSVKRKDAEANGLNGR